MRSNEVQEADELFKAAMKKAGVRFDHYGILIKWENNVDNIGVQPWLALSLALIKLAREKK